MNWTPEQRAAIEARGNLIVSAAAGAGKTAVLTERLCALVAAGTDVSRLLVLTFTRAAAAEMKNRIARRLMALSSEAESPSQQRYLRAQAHAVTSANISTMHAFCARVVRRHSHTLNVSPTARVAGELELAALKEQLREELLDDFGRAEHPGWHTLLAAFGDEERAFSALEECYQHILSGPAPFDWLQNAVAAYDHPAALLDTALAFAKSELLLVTDALQAAAVAVPAAWPEVRAVLDEDLSHARALLMMPDYEQYRAKLTDIAFPRLNFPRGTEAADKPAFQAPRKAYKDCINAQKERFWRPFAEECDCLRGSQAVLAALSSAVEAYDAAFSARKREKSLLDYNDLERLTLLALNNPMIAAEYRDSFDYIAVDEYQDSNRVQEAILHRVSRGDNLFLVGDVKQSIYRFRQAEPGLFLEKLGAADAGRMQRIDLSANFRSGAAVIGSVNGCFSAIMREELGGIAYDGRARLVQGTPNLTGSASLHIIERESDEPDEDAEAEDAVVEARFVATQIHALKQADPKLRYGDIAVLLRATTHALRFAATLAKNGIPCYAQSNGGYFDSIEVQVFLNLLRVIDNRRRDVPLISVMRASIGGFSESELAHIRARHKGGSFYEAASACAEDGDALGQKLEAFFDMLTRYRAESLLLSIEQLIGKLLDETGFYEEVGVLSGGEERQANLDALLDRARAFEESGARGLYAFLRHIELAKKKDNFGAAQTAAADVVRLLTIHKSKGLEFPVVFVCQLNAKFNRSTDREALILHGTQGLAVKYIDEGARLRRDNAFRQTLLQQIRREETAEEMRVLYVAMTRAKERLILCGCMKNAAEKTADMPPSPSPLAIQGAGSLLSWLVMSRGEWLPLEVHARSPWLVREEAQAKPAMPPESPAITQALLARLAWQYPFADALDLPAKAAVSQLERQEELRFDPPGFAADGAPTALSIGTAMHTALQRLPLGPLDKGGAAALIQSLHDSRLIGEAEAAALDPEALSWFSNTPLYERLCASRRAERELSFTYAMDAAALYDTPAEERVLLQGVIDACYLEEDGWVLIDYKTDAPRPDDTEESLKARHGQQIRLYAAALAALTKQPVKQCYVVYLSHRNCIAC